MGAGPKFVCSKCGGVVQSMHRHDFVWCPCKGIAIDGGDSYTRLLTKGDAVAEPAPQGGGNE